MYWRDWVAVAPASIAQHPSSIHASNLNPARPALLDDNHSLHNLHTSFTTLSRQVPQRTVRTQPTAFEMYGSSGNETANELIRRLGEGADARQSTEVESTQGSENLELDEEESPVLDEGVETVGEVEQADLQMEADEDNDDEGSAPRKLTEEQRISRNKANTTRKRKKEKLRRAMLREKITEKIKAMQEAKEELAAIERAQEDDAATLTGQKPADKSGGVRRTNERGGVSKPTPKGSGGSGGTCANWGIEQSRGPRGGLGGRGGRQLRKRLPVWECHRCFSTTARRILQYGFQAEKASQCCLYCGTPRPRTGPPPPPATYPAPTGGYM